VGEPGAIESESAQKTSVTLGKSGGVAEQNVNPSGISEVGSTLAAGPTTIRDTKHSGAVAAFAAATTTTKQLISQEDLKQKMIQQKAEDKARKEEEERLRLEAEEKAKREETERLRLETEEQAKEAERSKLEEQAQREEEERLQQEAEERAEREAENLAGKVEAEEQLRSEVEIRGEAQVLAESGVPARTKEVAQVGAAELLATTAGEAQPSTVGQQLNPLPVRAVSRSECLCCRRSVSFTFPISRPSQENMQSCSGMLKEEGYEGRVLFKVSLFLCEAL
jgi:hypothetical protein